MQLPDLPGYPTGAGFTITGFDARPSDGLIYAADGVGRISFGSTGDRNPSIAVLARTGFTLSLVRQWRLVDMGISGVDQAYINSATIQGVSHREATDRIHCCVQGASASKLIEFDPDAAVSGGNAAAGVVSVVDNGNRLNGIAIDNPRDTYVANTISEVRRRSIADGDITGLGTKLILPFTENDQGFHDKDTDRWWLTRGNDGEAQYVSAYQMDLNMGSATLLGSAALAEVDAIEGIWHGDIWREGEMLIASDGLYHEGTQNCIVAYPGYPTLS